MSERRPSRLSQLLLMQEKKRKQKKYRDKQGFVWRRMIPDELPTFRVPNLTLPNHPPPDHQNHPQESSGDHQNHPQEDLGDHNNQKPPGSHENLEPPVNQKNQENLGAKQSLDCSGEQQDQIRLGGHKNQEPRGSQQNHDFIGGQRNHDYNGGQRSHDSIEGQKNHDSLGGQRNYDSLGGPRNPDSLGGQRNNDSLGGPRNPDSHGGPRNHDSLGSPINHDSLGGQKNADSSGGQHNKNDCIGSPCPEPHDNPARADNSHPIQDSTESTSFRGGTNPLHIVSSCDSTDNLQEPFQTPPSPLLSISNQLSQSLTGSLDDPDACCDSDSGSLRSENSFQTCSSEPQLHLVPKQVSDNYKNSPSDREARKASFKTLQGLQNNAQNNLLNSFDAGTGPKENKPQNIDIR